MAAAAYQVVCRHIPEWKEAEAGNQYKQRGQVCARIRVPEDFFALHGRVPVLGDGLCDVLAML
jgi:hypothetical protein